MPAPWLYGLANPNGPTRNNSKIHEPMGNHQAINAASTQIHQSTKCQDYLPLEKYLKEEDLYKDFLCTRHGGSARRAVAMAAYLQDWDEHWSRMSGEGGKADKGKPVCAWRIRKASSLTRRSEAEGVNGLVAFAGTVS